MDVAATLRKKLEKSLVVKILSLMVVSSSLYNGTSTMKDKTIVTQNSLPTKEKEEESSDSISSAHTLDKSPKDGLP